jgi:uncharacterized membrane protein
MDHLWIFLMIFAELAWSFGIYLDKFLINTMPSEEAEEEAIGSMLIFGACFNIVIAAFSVLVLIFLNGPSGALSMITFDLPHILTALLVGILGVAWVIPYLYALHLADESTAPPIFQSVPVFGFFLGYFFFNELPSTFHMIGGTIIIFGALILNLSLMLENAKNRRIEFNKKSFGLMLLASFIIALIAFLFKDTAESANYWGTTFWMGMGAFFTGISMWAFITPFGIQFNKLITSRNWRLIGVNALNETLDQIAMLAFYGAILLGPSTALVQSANSYQPLILLIIGFILAKFGSKRHAHILTTSELLRRLLGVSIIVVGSLMIFI